MTASQRLAAVLLAATLPFAFVLASNAENGALLRDQHGNHWDEHQQAWADGKGHWWRWEAWRNADDSVYMQPDGLGHYWYWGAWRWPDGRLYEPRPAHGGCPGVIVETFGANAPAACAISYCESRWDPNATGSQGERGYFQVHPRYHADATYDPRGNALAAYRISGGGRDWSAWTCRWAAYG